MPIITGHQAYFAWRTRNYSSDANKVEIAYSVAAHDVSTFQDVYRRKIDGLLDASISADLFWGNATATTDIDAHLFNSLPSGTTPAGTQLWDVAPDGSASNRIRYRGNGILTGYNVDAPVDGVVTVSMSIESSGSITRGLLA